jgi:ribokinase
MARILVSGLINIETTLQVDSFPLAYTPVRYPFFGVASAVSGVGYNVAKALTVLGHDVPFVSIVGQDIAARQARAALADISLPDRYVLDRMRHTAQSVILYDRDGRRQIHVDVKDIQEQAYPDEVFEQAMVGCDAFALCNINFSRRFLGRAKQTGKPIATDVHALSRLDDEYNRDFMEAANILFMSDDLLPSPPEAWAGEVLNRFGPEVLVIGLGAQGALLCVRRDNFMERVPAVHTRPIVNTIGAGDALFSAFVHGYVTSGDPYSAIRQAVVFASYTIGAASAADGFLDRRGLEQLAGGRPAL